MTGITGLTNNDYVEALEAERAELQEQVKRLQGFLDKIATASKGCLVPCADGEIPWCCRSCPVSEYLKSLVTK